MTSTTPSEKRALLDRTIRWRFSDGPVAGQTFASGHDTWTQQRGSFELLPEPV